MLKTVKNNKNQIVGLMVNGQRHFLSREACHALSVEERNAKKEVEQKVLKLKEAKNNILSRRFLGRTEGIKAEISFNDDRTINDSNGKIEFIGSLQNLSPEEKRLALKVINQFLIAINQGQSEFHKELELLLHQTTKQVA